MFPYKHYDAGLIEDVVAGVVSGDDPETENYPCEGTINHWKWWMKMNEQNMEGRIKSSAHRFLDFGDGLLKSMGSLLEELKKRISPGWLKAAARFIYNSGGWLEPYPQATWPVHLLLFTVIFFLVYSYLQQEAMHMQKKEVKKRQNEETLKRCRMTAPLLDEGLDEGKRRQMREEAAEKNGITKRSLYRYEAGYRDSGFEGLHPMSRTKKRMQRLPDNFDEVLEQAVQLKREVPKRSVRRIIKIPELEGWAAPGVLKQSAMQRHLYEPGLGKKQMKRYTEKRATSSRRFCRPHRMELLQGDVKYGPDIRTADGELIKTHLSSLIDGHSWYIAQPEIYDNQRQEIAEDTFHKAVLKAGKFDCAYLDHGVQHTASHLGKACAKLGIRIVHAKPDACRSKGKIEKFLLLYLSDSKLTPRRLYAGLLGQPGLEAHFSAGIPNVCCRKRSGQSVRNRKRKLSACWMRRAL